MRLPLGTEVVLCPGDIVLDGDTVAASLPPPQKGAQQPNTDLFLLSRHHI